MNAESYEYVNVGAGSAGVRWPTLPAGQGVRVLLLKPTGGTAIRGSRSRSVGAAFSAGEILDGVKTADSPVGQPTQARAGHQPENGQGARYTVLQSLLARADEVI